MKPFVSLCLLMTMSVCVPCTSAFGQDDREPNSDNVLTRLSQSWESTIRPLLSDKCLECHSAIEHSGKLQMESINGLIRGGLSGPAIDRLNPAGSLLLKVLAHDANKHMPPDEQLNDDQIGLIAGWLQDLKQLESLPIEWQFSTELTEGNQPSRAQETYRDPVSQIPLGSDPSQVIDLALSAAWQANQVTPTAVAHDAVFARRLFLDLIGRIPFTEESLAIANVSQGLWLTNSQPIRDMVSAESSKVIQQVLQIEHSEQLLERLYKIILGRQPDDEERRRCVEFLVSVNGPANCGRHDARSIPIR